MEYYNSHNGQHRHSNYYHHCSRNQSFSSALLAAVCRSTEDDKGKMGDKKSRSGVETRSGQAEDNRLTRTSRFERQRDEDPWLRNEKYYMRGGSAKMGVFNAEKSQVEAANTQSRSELQQSFQSNMSSATSYYYSHYTTDTSSISSPYLSSDAESVYAHISSVSTANKTRRNYYHVPATRGDRTYKWTVAGDCSPELDGKSSVRDGDVRSMEKPFITADHHAMRMNSKSKSGKDFKKPIEPVSPGRKLASFFNSLFKAGFTNKGKLSSSSSVSESNWYNFYKRKASVCSSSSVQSRPCLSKTSRGSNNSSGRMSKKSVTFYPTTVIVDEDSRPCGVKSLQEMEKYSLRNANPSNYPGITNPSVDLYKLRLPGKELKHIVKEERHHAAASTAREVISKYHKTSNTVKAAVIAGLEKAEKGEEEDDESSCSSSELFELENLAAIDISKIDLYQKELPVYETTHFITNKAIAEGLIL